MLRNTGKNEIKQNIGQKWVKISPNDFISISQRRLFPHNLQLGQQRLHKILQPYAKAFSRLFFTQQTK